MAKFYNDPKRMYVIEYCLGQAGRENPFRMVMSVSEIDPDRHAKLLLESIYKTPIIVVGSIDFAYYCVEG